MTCPCGGTFVPAKFDICDGCGYRDDGNKLAVLSK